MSGTKSITGLILSNTITSPDSPPGGTQTGTISVTMSDGRKFEGTLTVTDAHLSEFVVVPVEGAYTIASVNLDDAIVAANAPSGALVGNLSVTLSNGAAFAGTLTVNDTAHFAVSGKALVTSAALAVGNYPVTVTATDQASTNHTLSAIFQIVAQSATVQLPGPLTNLASPAQTTSSITVGWAAPTSGGALDNGVHQIQYKAAASNTWIDLPAVRYCTPSHGSITDGSGNVWLINPTGSAGHPNAVMCNGAYANGFNSPLLYLVGSSVYHVNTAGTWYSFTPSGTVTASSVAWTSAGTTAPITAPGLTAAGLAANSTYNVRGNAMNSAGNGPATAPINVVTKQQITPPPGPVPTPAAATNAGFSVLAFFAGFDSPSEVTSDRSGNTTAKFYATASGLNYTIKDSVLSLNNSISSYNNDVSTVARAGAALTTPGAIRQGNGSGTRFKYGCYEALLKIDPRNISGQGWIAWWTSGYQGNVAGDNSANSIEWDFFEMFQGGSSSTGLWNWASSPVTTFPTFATSGWGDSMYLVSQSAADAAAGGYADWFIVGGVATPTKVEVYFNTKAGRAAGKADTTIWRVDTTRTYPVNAGGKQVNAIFDASRLCDMMLMLGGSSGSPFLCDYVAVWQ